MEREPVIMRGTKGREIDIYTNYINLEFEPNKGVFEYEVRFEPGVDSNSIRYKYLNEHRATIGNVKTFDGVKLYVPQKLSKDVLTLTSNNPADQSLVMK